MLFEHLYAKTDEQIGDWIARFVREQQPEDLFRDYKATLDLNPPKNKSELAKDLSAFANTEGGALFIGIDEEVDENGKKTGVPKLEYGISKIPDLEIRVRQILEDGMAPRLPNVIVREIPIDGTKFVYVIAHQKSSVRPHMVRGYGDRRYYKRSGNHSIPMEHLEIQELFQVKLRSTKTTEQYIKGLDDGSALIKKSNEPLTFKALILPLPVTEGLADLFSESGKDLWLGRNFWQPGGGGHSEWKPCGDGVVLHQYMGTAGESAFIVKLHPSGAVSYARQALNESMVYPTSVFAPDLLRVAFDKNLKDFIIEHLEKIPHNGDVLVHLTTEHLQKTIKSGVSGGYGQPNEHPEYLQSGNLKAETVTNIVELKTNFKAVADRLLDDIGLQIGIWNYAEKIKKASSGSIGGWLDSYFRGN